MQIKVSSRTDNLNKNFEKLIALKQQIKDREAKGEKFIDFSIGDPKEDIDTLAIRTIKENIEKRAGVGYPNFAGEPEYRKACCEYMKKFHNTDLNWETEVCGTNGVKDAIAHFLLSFIDKGDLVICPTPNYPPYVSGTKDAGGELYFVELNEQNNYLIDLDAIPEEIAKKAKLIWINYPNSPLSISAPKWWLEKLANWAEKYNVVIAADEGAYIDLYYKEKPYSIFEVKPSKEGIIAFYSLSKRNNMMSYRVGFVCGDERLIKAYKTIQQRRCSGTPVIIQDSAIAVLKNDDFVKKSIEKTKEKKDLLINALRSIGLEVLEPDTAFYLWIKAPKNMDGEGLADLFLKHNIVLTPGNRFGTNCDQYVRLAISPVLEDVKKACEIIKKLKVEN